MSKIAHLLLGFSTTLLLVLAGGTAAWGMPAPFDPATGPVIDSGVVDGAVDRGTSWWGFVAVSLASAVVAAALTLAAAHLIALHRGTVRRATAA